MSIFSSSKKIIIAAFMALCVGVPGNALLAAPATAAAEQRALLTQIEQLLREIVRLQQLLVERSLADGAVQIEVPTEVYQSRFFNTPSEAVYAVTRTGLVRIDENTAVRTLDAELFALLEAVVGKDVLRHYLDDFRVFNGERRFGAFVETKANSDKWLMAVNRFGYKSDDQGVADSYIDLYVHEYAHLLLFREKVFNEAFEQKFWTRADTQHSERIAERSNQLALMKKYFDANEQRFVSDYATMNPDEDLAETFVVFVTEAEPTGLTVRDEKVRYFYTNPDLVTERTRLRANLIALGKQL